MKRRCKQIDKEKERKIWKDTKIRNHNSIGKGFLCRGLSMCYIELFLDHLEYVGG